MLIAITTNSRTFPSTPKETPYVLAAVPSYSFPSPETTNVLSVSVDLPVLDIS